MGTGLGTGTDKSSGSGDGGAAVSSKLAIAFHVLHNSARVIMPNARCRLVAGRRLDLNRNLVVARLLFLSPFSWEKYKISPRLDSQFSWVQLNYD